MRQRHFMDHQAATLSRSATTPRGATIFAALFLLLLSGCHGVDPLLQKPPPATRADAVLGTPFELRSELGLADIDLSLAKLHLSKPLWSDALSLTPAEFRALLSQRQPKVAGSSEAIQQAIGLVFTEAAALSTAAQQIRWRLEAMETIRQKTDFNNYVLNRKDLFNRKAEAMREQRRLSAEATRFGIQADAARSTANDYRVERIDYVNSSGRVVESKYTAAHDDKQRARLLLPFANAAAREFEEKAAAESERLKKLDLIIAATSSADMDQVESQLFTESDRLTGELWPKLESHRKNLRRALDSFAALTGS